MVQISAACFVLERLSLLRPSGLIALFGVNVCLLQPGIFCLLLRAVYSLNDHNHTYGLILFLVL